MSFCHRWRQSGGEVWANVRHPVGHIGPHEWLIRYEDYLIEKKNGTPVEVPASEAA
jgi:hypothetical protein